MWYLSVCGSRGGEPRCTCLRSRRGIVNWPDGWPLTNAQIQFYPQGTDLTPITETTGPDGSYTSRACAQITCSNLQAWFSGDNSNGFGDLCNIQLSTDLGSDQGFTLEQGQVNWVVNPQNCDPDPRHTGYQSPSYLAAGGRHHDRHTHLRSSPGR